MDTERDYGIHTKEEYEQKSKENNVLCMDEIEQILAFYDNFYKLLNEYYKTDVINFCLEKYLAMGIYEALILMRRKLDTYHTFIYMEQELTPRMSDEFCELLDAICVLVRLAYDELYDTDCAGEYACEYEFAVIGIECRLDNMEDQAEIIKKIFKDKEDYRKQLWRKNDT